MLHTTRARALAKMRRINETLTAIGTAEDHFAHSTPDNAPSFLAAHLRYRIGTLLIRTDSP